jgi:hypothetical protein
MPHWGKVNCFERLHTYSLCSIRLTIRCAGSCFICHGKGVISCEVCLGTGLVDRLTEPPFCIRGSDHGYSIGNLHHMVQSAAWRHGCCRQVGRHAEGLHPPPPPVMKRVRSPLATMSLAASRTRILADAAPAAGHGRALASVRAVHSGARRRREVRLVPGSLIHPPTPPPSASSPCHGGWPSASEAWAAPVSRPVPPASPVPLD